MQNQKQKEQLPLRIAKITLAIIVITGVGTIIFGGGAVIMKYYSGEVNDRITKPVNQETGNYYDLLEKKCDGSSCCLSSLKYMKENNYKEANKDHSCPDGFKASGLKCITSLSWCEPIKEENCAKSGEFANPEELKGKTKYLDNCCPGLKKLNVFEINDNGECEEIIGNPFPTCMPCGNGVCESIDGFKENKCNCPKDCGDGIDISDWQTYRNEEFGFEFKHSENWKQCEEKNVCFRKEISFEPPRRFTEISIEANQNNQNLSLDEIIFDFESTGRVYEQKEYITLNNKKVFKAEIANLGMVSGRQFLIVGDNYWYDIIIGGTDTEKVEIDQILSTFKFINQNEIKKISCISKSEKEKSCEVDYQSKFELVKSFYYNLEKCPEDYVIPPGGCFLTGISYDKEYIQELESIKEGECGVEETHLFKAIKKGKTEITTSGTCQFDGMKYEINIK